MVHVEGIEQRCDHFEGSQTVVCVVIRSYVTPLVSDVIMLSTHLI